MYRYEETNSISLIKFGNNAGYNQPSVNASMSSICIERAYRIGYDLSESIENIMNALAKLEADCVYSGMMSQEAKCLVWYYDTGIRVTHLILASPDSTDLADYFTE